jgi:hypothetical protein
LSRLSTWFGGSNVRERGNGESFVPTKLCFRPPHVGPVFEALPAWIAGTSPAMTARAETNSHRYKSLLDVQATTSRTITLMEFGAPPRQPDKCAEIDRKR